jgi:hypothetical protein
MAYAHHSPISSSFVQQGQVFDPQVYAQQSQQYQLSRPSPAHSPQPSPRLSPQPPPQQYAYQQVNRPPPSPQYNHNFAFPPRSPQPPIQQSYCPPPSPQPIFPLPQGYTPPTHIPPSLQVRVKTPAPPEQTTASPRPQYAYLPQQNVITSVSTSSPPRVASPSRPLPPPQRSRPESVPPNSRIQIPTSSFTENTLYRQPSAISVSPTRSPIVPSPGPATPVSPQPQVQALLHRPSYPVRSASPPKPVSSFVPQVPAQIPGQIPTHIGQIPTQLPSQRSESPNRGRPLPTPTPRTPSPTKSIQPPTAFRSLTDNTPQRILQQQRSQQHPSPLTRSVTEVNPPSSSARENTVPSPIHRPTSSMSTISTSSSYASSLKEITLPPVTTPGQPFVPYWKRNLQGGPRAHGIQRRGTVAEGPSSTSATIEAPPNPSSFSSSNPPTSSFPTKSPSRAETKPGTGITRKPTGSFDFGAREPPHPEPRSRANGIAGSKDLTSTPGTPSQTPSTSSFHYRRGAETTRSDAGHDPEPRSNPNTRPQLPSQPNHNLSGSNPSTVSTSTTASTSGSGFSNRSTVPVPSKPVRSQTYDPKPPSRREDSFGSIANQHRGPPSPNKFSNGEKVGLPPMRAPSPQYGILDMPRSRFSQRVEAKTEALNGLRSRGTSPVRNESPVKGIPPVSPFARSESPTRNSSPTRPRGLPRPTPATSNPPSTSDSPFPPALKRSSVTPQSVTLQMATIGVGEDRNRGRLPDQHQVQRSPSPPKPQQQRTQQNNITTSESGWPTNLPRLPRTPATSQHLNSTVNSVNEAHRVTSNRPNSSSHSSASDRNPVRPVTDLDLDDAPPPSLRRSPSPASSVASSNFSSFSAAMESYRNGVSGSQPSVYSRDSHQRTGSVPVRQSTEPAKGGYRHSDSRSPSQPRAGARQQTFPGQPQVQSQPQPPLNQHGGRSHSPVRQQQQQQQQQQHPPPQSPRRQPASPAVPSIDIDTAPVPYRSRSSTIPTIKTPQTQSPQRQKFSFSPNPDSDDDDDMNGPRIAVSVVDDSGPGSNIPVSGRGNGPNISISIGGPEDYHGNGPTINAGPGEPSVTVNGGKKDVAELPTIRRGGGLSCGGCGGMIVGRVVNAMGAKWHPRCFRCCMCNELLENLSSYEKDGRSFCHLDYHEVWFICGFLPFDRLD